MTNKEEFFKKHHIGKDESLSIKDIAKQAHMPEGAIQESYNRGVGAWKTNISSVRLQKDFSKNPNVKRYPRNTRLPKERWGYGRAYAFANKTASVFKGADRDIAEKYGLLK
jgi:hypothetical protein